MNIAILGWGSLIWDPRNLEIDKTIGEKGWHNEGPMLPIEFARISQDGRLTLVIEEGSKHIQTLYAISKFKNLELAALDLAMREGCRKNKIGTFSRENDAFYPNTFPFKQLIKRWIDNTQDIDAVIWTNLSGNFQNKIGLKLTPDNAVNYLKYQSFDVKEKAEQYIHRTPEIVRTSIRAAIEKELGWTRV